MKINKEDKSISFEDATATPELARLKDIPQYVKNAHEGTLFPKNTRKVSSILQLIKFTLYTKKVLLQH
jgi:hypothetical protein